MSPEKLPAHAVLVRWGMFKLDIIGRWPIIAWGTSLAALFGLKVWLW
jgi:hypothetical protein